MYGVIWRHFQPVLQPLTECCVACRRFLDYLDGIDFRGATERASLQKLPSCRHAARRFVLRVVNSSMMVPRASHAPPGPGSERGWRIVGRMAQPTMVAGRSGPLPTAVRHATCITPDFRKNLSQSEPERVDFSHRRAKAVRGTNGPPAAGNSRSVAWHHAARHVGWNQGALNQGALANGNRKRTRVRVACGGGIRRRSLGHQPIHGHLGLSVVGRDLFSPVVLSPGCEPRVRQRHFSRGPGLLAALISRDTFVARISAHEQPADGATRPDGFAVTRAASVPQCLPERPEAGRGAHHPGPRTRLRQG